MILNNNNSTVIIIITHVCYCLLRSDPLTGSADIFLTSCTLNPLLCSGVSALSALLSSSLLAFGALDCWLFEPGERIKSHKNKRVRNV